MSVFWREAVNVGSSTSALGASEHLDGSNIIEGDESDMSTVRSTSRIEEVEDGCGNNEQNEYKPENGQDGDQVSALARVTYYQKR